METKKLVAGTIYATCDGKPVIPIGPEVTNDWVFGNFPVKDDNGKFVKTVKEIRQVPKESKDTTAKVDPWGGCFRSNSSSRYRSYDNPVRGVLCETFQYDRNGDEIKGSKRTRLVVPVKDIKGTWLEFLTLHGERIRDRVDVKSWEHESNELERELSKIVEKLVPADRNLGGVYCQLRKIYKTVKPEPKRFSEVQVTFRIYTSDQYDRLLAVMKGAKIPAAEIKKIADIGPMLKIFKP